jgi:hypothetical protein
MLNCAHVRYSIQLAPRHTKRTSSLDLRKDSGPISSFMPYLSTCRAQPRHKK